MSVNGHLCLVGLIIISLFLTGISGAKATHEFISSGENVHLPCNNALSDCTSTTWNYGRHSESVELVAQGKKRTDRERHERLSLGSYCSLIIRKVTKEDYGLYSCRQYVNGQQQGTDARVFLHVLHISSSSSQTEIRPDRSVTLSCQLYHHQGVSCDHWIRFEDIQLKWVNQAGVNLMTDPRYQILFSPSLCIISLTTTLLNEDHNREWKCQLTQRNQLKTSVTYTVKYSIDTKTPVSSSTPTISTPLASKATVTGIAVAALAVLLIAVIVCVILKRRVGNKGGINDSVVTDKNKFSEANDPIDISIHPTPNTKEQKDEETYAEVATYSKFPDNKDHEDEKVTFSSTRGGRAELPDNCSQLYATVNKNHRKT